MSLDELRAFCSEINKTHPMLFFNIGRKFGWMTLEQVPAEQRLFYAQEIAAAAAQPSR